MRTPHLVLPSDAVECPGLRGTVRVVGGPGTGKSTLLVRTAAAHVRSGTDPESVLLLTGSARLRVDARAAITSAVLGAGRPAVREPLVRTVHSYAFAVLRIAAQRTGAPPPRLITSAEQDGIVRELLAGDAADGDAASVCWPARLRPALTTVGFATELRDLLARCAERGIDPVALQRIGHRAGRPEWVAAGRFAQVYEQVMLLRSAVGMAAPQATVPALGAAELVGAALEALATDAELLAAERARVRLLLVDDAQHLDPQAARLVRVLAAGAELTVIAGDPAQSVFGYRGADPALLRGDDEPVVVLSESYRCAPAVARAVTDVAAALPAAGGGRSGDGPGLVGRGAEQGSVVVRTAASVPAECAMIADALRRAHLVDGIPWSQMAVLVRSLPRVGPALGRALTTSGVPVRQPAPTTALVEHRAVAALLDVLDAAAEGGTEVHAVDLLTGPIGRVDPVSLRQLRRTLRRTGDRDRPFGSLVGEAIATGGTGLPDQLARPLRRVRAVLGAARRSVAAGDDPRLTLWQVWQHSGFERRWLAAVERGGSAGTQAGRDLEAITALFDVAEQYVGRTTGATLRGVIDHVRALVLSAPGRDGGSAEDAVALLSAHAALGREWEFVVVAGLQEGLWPNTAPRGGVLATQRLVDVIDGVAEAGVSTRAPVLADERRLLVAALGRARTRVLVTAVDGDGDDGAVPSPFLHELAQLATPGAVASDMAPIAAPRVLAPAAVVGQLRALVCAPEDEVDDDLRRCAAVQLARLAAAGVAGAAPAQWRAATAWSTAAPLWSGDEQVVTMSPSTLQTLADCPLRWLLERHGAADGHDVRSVLGSLVHALVSDPTATEAGMHAELERLWERLPFESQWYAANELERHRSMLSTFVQWRESTRRELTAVGAEVCVDGVLTPAGNGPGVRVRGRVDRLERDAEGRLVAVDLKTGKTPVTKDDAQRHAQLAMYQLAIADGVVPDGASPGGGRLVYLGKAGAGGATERAQDALTVRGCDDWRATVRAAAEATRGPDFVARIGDGCAHCSVRAMCPAQAALRGAS